MPDATDDSLLNGRVRLLQPARGHRAGTDAVLLAAAAGARPGEIVVDVGAATGAVGLMVAVREPGAQFVFVEREPGMADLVLTNPPFLEEGQARVSPDRRRAAAHALPPGGLEAWLAACTGFLKPKGRFVMIHRADRTGDCLDGLKGRLGGVTLRFIHPSADQPAIRVLLSGIKGSRAPLEVLPPIMLNGADGRFTPQAEALHRGEGFLA
jgi:tRNA1(Val) A37 N6-methylase TrmN6